MGMRRLQILGLLLVVLAPAIYGLYYVSTYSAEIPFGDEWVAIIPLIPRLYAGQITYADIVATHNEHRIPTARLILLALGYVSHFNFRWPTYGSWVLYCVGYLSVLIFLARDLRSWRAGLLWSSPAAWLLFSPRQEENLLIGLQICIVLAVVAAIGVMLLLSCQPYDARTMVAAITLAIISAYSFAFGLMIWPAGTLLLAGRYLLAKPAPLGGRRWRLPNLRWLLAWSAAGLVTFATYFWGWVRPTPAFGPGEPANPAFFAVVTAGTPLTIDVTSALYVGIALLTAYVVTTGLAIWRAVSRIPLADRSWAGLGLMAFAILSIIAITNGRAILGIDLALTPRYSLASSLAVIALFLLLSDHSIANWWTARVVAPAMAILFIAGMVVVYRHGDLRGQAWHASFTVLRGRLEAYTTLPPDQLATLSPIPGTVSQYVPYLQEHHLVIWRD